MDWRMKLYLAVNAIALAYCAVLAWEIVKEVRRARARRVAPETRTGASFARSGAFSTRTCAWPSLVSLLFSSGALEAAR